MAQKKGQTGNPNGRPKGTPNKTNKELREAINLIVSKNIHKLDADIKSLEPKDRLAFIEKLLKYVIPQVQAVPIEKEQPPPFNVFQWMKEKEEKRKEENQNKVNELI